MENLLVNTTNQEEWLEDWRLCVAYGAKQYQQLGVYLYCAITSLSLVCIPVSIIWTFMDKLLTHIVRPRPFDRAKPVDTQFGSSRDYLPTRLCNHWFDSSCLRVWSFALFLHIPLCWFLMFKVGLGNVGAALSTDLCNWLNTVILLMYLKYSSVCEKNRTKFSTDVFACITEFIVFADSHGFLEWSSFELIVLLSGFLPNSKLETSVLSICLTTTSLHFFMPYSIGAAASNRISNKLGAGNPHAARAVVWAGMLLAVTEAVIISTILFFCRSFWGYVYSTDIEVVDYIKRLTPLLFVSLISDSLQAVLSGVARGCGRQRLGAYINLGAYYIFGIPGALVLGFLIDLRGMGLWIGMMTGASVQAFLYVIVTYCINWQKEATKARQRIFKDAPADENVLA